MPCLVEKILSDRCFGEIIVGLVGPEGLADLSASSQLLNVNSNLGIRVGLSWSLDWVESGRC